MLEKHVSVEVVFIAFLAYQMSFFWLILRYENFFVLASFLSCEISTYSLPLTSVFLLQLWLSMFLDFLAVFLIFGVSFSHENEELEIFLPGKFALFRWTMKGVNQKIKNLKFNLNFYCNFLAGTKHSSDISELYSQNELLPKISLDRVQQFSATTLHTSHSGIRASTVCASFIVQYLIRTATYERKVSEQQ